MRRTRSAPSAQRLQGRYHPISSFALVSPWSSLLSLLRPGQCRIRRRGKVSRSRVRSPPIGMSPRMVNEYLETNRPDILAAGDVASYYDALFDKHRRAEHWDNAVSQGRYCARVLSGERVPFVHVPYFFPTSSISLTSSGEILRPRRKSSSVETWRLGASAS